MQAGGRRSGPPSGSLAVNHCTWGEKGGARLQAGTAGATLPATRARERVQGASEPCACVRSRTAEGASAGFASDASTGAGSNVEVDAVKLKGLIVDLHRHSPWAGSLVLSVFFFKN